MLSKEGIEDFVILNFEFTAWKLARHFPLNYLVYYCGDDFIGNGRFSIGILNSYHRTLENRVIRESRCCIVTTEYLHNKLLLLNKNTHLIRLGAPADIPPEAVRYTNGDKGRPSIKVGYVGNLRPTKFGIDWVRSCLGTGMEFVIIGPTNQDVLKLLGNEKDVTFLGPRAGVELYDALGEVNVCIAPYNVSNINQGGSPMKMWLYFALGKPVVLTELPGIGSWKFEDDIVYRTENRADFSQLIRIAFLRDSEQLFQRRVTIGRENTWARKVDELFEVTDQFSGGAKQ
jgi:glycosyltransferase involved in cell wall biosynthesis